MANGDPAPELEVKIPDGWVEDVEDPTEKFDNQCVDVSQQAKKNTVPYVLYGYYDVQSGSGDFTVGAPSPTMVIFQLASEEILLRNSLTVDVLVDADEPAITLWSPELKLFGIGATPEEAYEAFSSELVELRNELEKDADNLGNKANAIRFFLSYLLGD